MNARVMKVMKKVYIDTNGCEEARLDAQKLKNFLCGTDYASTDDARIADIIVFYACGHLQESESESIGIIKRLINLKKDSSMLVVWGCLPEINREAVENVYEGPMIGPENWVFFSDLFNQPKERMYCVHANRLSIRNRLMKPPLLSGLGLLNLLWDAFHYESRRVWYIKVASGCRENCTYCSDHLAFKCLRSQPMEMIISQFELGLEKGFKRFFLVGRDLGSYGRDIDTDLPTLLNRMLESHPDMDYQFSLYNMSPKSLIELYPRLDNLFSSGRIYEVGSHIQSGSDRILRLMGRNFSIAEWLRIMKNISRNYPNTLLATSIMVGFPTETEQDFGKSLELVDDILFDQVDLYKYEERPNLASLRLGGRVPNKVKEARFRMMTRRIIVNSIIKKIRRRETFYLAQFMILYLIQFLLEFGFRRRQALISSKD
jgi:MiaB/RimO family radical SAM methylthiotransferase